MNKKMYGVPILVILVFITVYSAGCMGSAMVPHDPFPDGRPGASEKDLPPLFNYQVPGGVQVDDGVPGIFHPGDILQPPKDSPLYDPDIAVIVIRDTGDGRYEVGGVVHSENSWYRLPDVVPGLVDHVYIERTFSFRSGHEDYYSLTVIKNWHPAGSSQV